nr:transcription factor DIVARICATA-like [Ipomoea batatas]
MDYSASLWMDNSSPNWTRHEDKMFEVGLVRYGEERIDRWVKIAELLPLKTARDVEQHYQILLADVADIDAGLIEVPNYLDNPVLLDEKKGKEPRKQAHQWTAEEHKRFLEGLNRYGKGDWKSIARQCVKTRSATQVASHAQKYFIHLEKDAKNRTKKRSSIYDVSLDD